MKKKAKKKAVRSPAFTTLLARVEAIDWEARSNGETRGVAEAFALLADPKKRAKALATLKSLFVRRDGLGYPIAGLAMPFLVELLAMPDEFDRAALLVFMADVALWDHGRWIDDGFVPETSAKGFLSGRARARTYWAFAKGEPIYEAMLTDADPRVRSAAAFALAWVPTAKALDGSLGRETDPIARATIALSLAVRRSGEPAERLLAAEHPLERLAGAIACTFVPKLASDPRVLEVLRDPIPKDDALPWCSGDLELLAKGRLITVLFGEEPDERPASPPVLRPEQQEALRAMFAPELPDLTRTMLQARGFPEDDTQLRRLAGIPRAIPEGPHGPIFDRWMTWAEIGTPETNTLATELAGEVALEDAITIVEKMYYAQQEASEQIAGFPFPELPDNVPSPDPKEDYNVPGASYRWYRGDVDELVKALDALLRKNGFETWLHGRDGADDLNQGEIVGWHDDGREVSAGFDRKGELVCAHYEWGRSLVRPFTFALMQRHGAEDVLGALKKHALDGMRQAIGLIRLGWAIAERTGQAPDPICDELAFIAGTNRHYIYWVTRAHFDRIPADRRAKMVERLVSDENDDKVFGWVRFAPTDAVRKLATKMIPRTFGTSYYDLDGAIAASEEMGPFADDSLVPSLKRAVKKDDNPVMQVLLLGRLGHLDAVKKALDSKYPMARAAAKKVLAEKK